MEEEMLCLCAAAVVSPFFTHPALRNWQFLKGLDNIIILLFYSVVSG